MLGVQCDQSIRRHKLISLIYYLHKSSGGSVEDLPLNVAERLRFGPHMYLVPMVFKVNCNSPCVSVRNVGVTNPCGGHGRERRAAEYAVQAGAGAERGGSVAVHRPLGRARRARAAAPRRRRCQRHDPFAALLLRGQSKRVQGTNSSRFIQLN